MITLLLVHATHAAVIDECHLVPPAPPGYDPTVCHPLNETNTLPAKCLGPTWSLDPPCPRCWLNTAADYTPGAPTELSPGQRAAMSSLLSRYLANMEATHPPSHRNGGTVFSGLGGRALLLLKLHEVTGNASYLSTAREYTDAMLTHLPAQKLIDRVRGAVGFQWSHVGMLCVAAVCAERAGDPAAAEAHAQQVAEVVQVASRGAAGRYDDFDSGRAGLIYAVRFLEANLAPRAAPLVPRTVVVRLATAIVDRGAATGAAHGHDWLQWHGPNDAGLWLGQSHGSAGILQQLLEVPELWANATATRWLTRTLDATCAAQQPSGNFPTEYYNRSQDVLVQWDHGAPGVSAMLLRAWRRLGTARYRQAALRALDVTWRRGLLAKGLMTCHGVGGNTWMMLYAAQQLASANDVDRAAQLRHRAIQFQNLVLAHPLLSGLDQMRRPQPEPEAAWSFWTGSIESAVLLWTELLYRGVANASLTGWQPRL